jgi:hypothetical protein
MKLRRFTSIIVLALAGMILTGCGRKHDASEAGHGHDEESPSGASFKAGKGVTLTDETRQSLGVETIEVAPRKLALEIRFSAQVFGESHKPSASETYHAECAAKAAGLIAQDKAVQVHPGQPAQLTKTNESLSGVVLGVNKALAIGDVEILVGITNAGARLKPGDFLSVAVSIPREQTVMAVPKSAVLRTAEGAFVYTQNGEAYFRTAIKTGAEAEGFVEVIDGLLDGDVVVTKPVEKLWLIELRATKGGGHSH